MAAEAPLVPEMDSRLVLDVDDDAAAAEPVGHLSPDFALGLDPEVRRIEVHEVVVLDGRGCFEPVEHVPDRLGNATAPKYQSGRSSS